MAAAFNIIGPAALYGRYWGATEFHSGLHFETCYYQAIEFCIANGIAVFEGGAQGEHKLARGLLPVRTVSAHWLARPEFADAVANSCKEKRAASNTTSTNLPSTVRSSKPSRPAFRLPQYWIH